jgi:hypothetical protein
MQGYANSKCDRAVVAPLILYNNQTSLSKNTKVIGHPFVMSITTCENRSLDEGHALLAILPFFHPLFHIRSNLQYSKNVLLMYYKH